MGVIDQPRDQTISSAPRTATSADVDRLKDVLARAFEDDPVFGWLMPDEATRRERLRLFFEIELRQIALARGVVWTSQEVSGGALCMPPGAWRVPARVLFRQGPTIARAFGARLPRATGLLAMIERRHIREPHYYFAYIGVAPEAQGHGLGTLLMGPTLERCDSEVLAAYLEASSERNAALYERLGLKLKAEITFAGSPPLRLMLRPPETRR